MGTNGTANPAALGAFEREYRVSKAMIVTLLILGIGSLLFGVLMLALFVFKLDPSANAISDKIGGTILILFFLIGGSAITWFYFAFRTSRVMIYANGLLVSRGRKEQTFLWDEISALYVDVVIVVVNGKETVTRRYEIRKLDGEKVNLTKLYQQVEEIGQRLEAETYQRMYPGWLAGLRKNASPEGLAFEPFRLRRDALIHNTEELPIGQIGNVEVSDGKIKISQRDAKRPWATVAYSKVPNAAVFLGLLEAMRVP